MLRSVLQRHWDKPHWLLFILKDIVSQLWGSQRKYMSHWGWKPFIKNVTTKQERAHFQHFPDGGSVLNIAGGNETKKEQPQWAGRWRAAAHLQLLSNCTVPCPRVLGKDQVLISFSIKRMFVWLHCWFAFSLQFWQSGCQKERWLLYQTALSVTPLRTQVTRTEIFRMAISI